MSDLVQGLVTLMASDYTLPVNIGNPEERSIKTFANLIRDMVGSGSDIVHKPEVEDDMFDGEEVFEPAIHLSDDGVACNVQ